MPPDHGAAVVRLILDDATLDASWRGELDAMRSRLNRLRSGLAATHPRLAPIADQRGMFAMLPISADEVVMLRERHGIYMAGSGRISIAGLRDDTIGVLAAALTPLFDD